MTVTDAFDRITIDRRRPAHVEILSSSRHRRAYVPGHRGATTCRISATRSAS